MYIIFTKSENLIANFIIIFLDITAYLELYNYTVIVFFIFVKKNNKSYDENINNITICIISRV